ncbi:MAG: class IV adenylate cyclase [Bacteroidetes bacterium]|nr:class IV adenylate cyclase [Bacteroidota bacterium]
MKNIEIKAHCKDTAKIRLALHKLNASFKGLDHQIDTYFNCTHGRLKLREGNIENNLIHYFRNNQAGPKKSDFSLFKTDYDLGLKELLEKAMGIKIVIDKKREIYFIENVKFHIDQVKQLGEFVEIEVVDESGELSDADMIKVCNKYINLFGLTGNDLIDRSYSDLLLEKQAKKS